MAQGIFEDQDTGQVSGGASPVGAAQPAPSLATTAASSGLLQNLGNLVGDLFQGNQVAQKKEQLSQQNSAMAGYAQKITALNAGVAQGTIKQADAQRQQRAAYNQIIANHPELVDKMTSLNTGLSNSSGLGDTLSKGTAVDQATQEDTKAATTAGFITQSMTPEQQQQGLQAYQQQQHALNQMNFYSKQLGIQQQKTSIQAQQANIAYTQTQRANAAYDLQIKRNKANVQNSVSDVVIANQTRITGLLGDIYNKVQTGQMSAQEGNLQVQQLHDQFSQQVNQVRGAAGSDFIDGISKPTEDVFTSYGNLISGKTDAATAQNQVEIAQNKALLPIMKDPIAARTMAISKVAGNTLTPQLVSNFGPHLIDLITGNLNNQDPGNHTPNNPQQQAEMKTYFDTLNHVTANLKDGNPGIQQPKETLNEVKLHTNQALQAVSDFSSSQKNPQQLNAALDWMASPEFASLRSMNVGLTPSAVEGAKNAIQINYNDKLIPAVQDEWRNNSTVTSIARPPGGFPAMGAGMAGATATTADTSTAVRYSWNGNSLVFKPAPGYERNQSVLAKVQHLQQKVAPLITRQVRVAAHLDGSQDYGKYFKQEEQSYFGNPATTPDVPAE